jgi:hypothetical protein
VRSVRMDVFEGNAAGLFPQILYPQAQVKLASLDAGECAKSCARRSVCFCSQSGGGVSIHLDIRLPPRC